MKLSNWGSFDQIDLPASNDAILDAYIGAQEHMNKVIDWFLDKVFRTPNISEISEEKVYALFWINPNNTWEANTIEVVRQVMRTCLHKRGYELFSWSHAKFKVSRLEDAIYSDMAFHTPGFDRVKYPQDSASVTEEVTLLTRRIMENAWINFNNQG